MKTLWHDAQSHPRIVRLFAYLWIAAWALTVLTWWYDEAGYSAGMRDIAVPFHFLLPLGAGLLAGWWQGSALRGLKYGALAGLLFNAANMLVLYLWSVVLIGLGKGQPDPEMSVWSALFEALAMGLFYCVVGVILGAAAGLIGGLASAGMSQTNPTHRPSA